jgi:hypothetical protein
MDMLEKKPQPPVKHGVYNPDSGAPPPQDIDGGSAKPAPKASKPKKMASGGMTSASKRADGIASRGKTKCKIY